MRELREASRFSWFYLLNRGWWFIQWCRLRHRLFVARKLRGQPPQVDLEELWKQREAQLEKENCCVYSAENPNGPGILTIYQVPVPKIPTGNGEFPTVLPPSLKPFYEDENDLC